VIDAHVHLWDGPLEWMTDEMEVLRRPYGLDELRPSLAAHGVDGVVLVQTHSSLEETRRFLALADTEAIVAGVVGWVELTDPGVADVLAELAESPRLVGVRHQVQDEADPAWLLRDDVLRALAAVRDAGLAYDLLVRPRELPAALEVARRVPALRLVIDHAAKPPVATGGLEPWRTRMAQFAGLEHVSCKVSGLVTEADWARWQPDDLVPYVSQLADWFGPDRLLFGSDWPVCLLAASYDEVTAACEHVLGDLAPLGENARRVYGLTCAPSSQTRA
jgi:L-fuconolactonase